VGATAEVDVSSLSRIEYARMKIAARDISRIPESAKRVVLPYLYDFYYEREVEDVEVDQKIEIQVPIGQGGGQHNQKKAKPNDQEPSQRKAQLQLECLGKDRPVDAKMKATMGENTISNLGSCFVPAKVDWEKGVEKPKKLMGDAQKSFQNINVLSSEELKILYNGDDRV
jgi:hypothetical protein